MKELLKGLVEKIEDRGKIYSLCIDSTVDRGTTIYRAGYRREDGTWLYCIPSIDPTISIRELKGYQERSKNKKNKNKNK